MPKPVVTAINELMKQLDSLKAETRRLKKMLEWNERAEKERLQG